MDTNNMRAHAYTVRDYVGRRARQAAPHMAEMHEVSTAMTGFMRGVVNKHPGHRHHAKFMQALDIADQVMLHPTNEKNQKYKAGVLALMALIGLVAAHKNGELQ